MKVIIVYDVKAGRTKKFHDECQKYLTWIQNSVFEGEISPGKKSELEEKLKDLVEDNESIVIYSWKIGGCKRKIIGEAPDPQEVLL